ADRTRRRRQPRRRPARRGHRRPARRGHKPRNRKEVSENDMACNRRVVGVRSRGSSFRDLLTSGAGGIDTEDAVKTQLNVMLVLINLALLLSVAGVTAQAPAARSGIGVAATLGSAFTYQGRLTDSGAPATGNYDFQFKLYDSGSGGNLVGSP